MNITHLRHMESNTCATTKLTGSTGFLLATLRPCLRERSHTHLCLVLLFTVRGRALTVGMSIFLHTGSSKFTLMLLTRRRCLWPCKACKHTYTHTHTHNLLVPPSAN